MSASQQKPSAIPGLEPILVSAPFGNYIRPQGATATLGTFTAEARGGRIRQILRTVRYYPRLKAWVNRIGLRNPGMPWLVKKVEAGKVDVSKAVVSIHGFDEADWDALLEQTKQIRPLAVELNMSCPNVGEIGCPEGLFDKAVATGVPVIVKLPPVNYQGLYRQAIQAGARSFHCCNTLPVPAGGLSGAPLQPLSLACIRWIREQEGGAELTLVGGGGIRAVADIDRYAEAGADHVALGTKTMNPVLLVTHGPIRPLIEYAHQRLVGAGGE
ncbi:MAG: hypothetical protein ACLFV3_12495 [Phycisphaeraceae bacterium]